MAPGESRSFLFLHKTNQRLILFVQTQRIASRALCRGCEDDGSRCLGSTMSLSRRRRGTLGAEHSFGMGGVDF